MGNFIANSLSKEYEIVGFDILKNKYYQTYDDMDEFLSLPLDLIIDFSYFELSNVMLKKALINKIKVITGTSSITNIEDLKDISEEYNVSFVYLENFSKGISSIFNFIDRISYDKVEIIEQHYITKKDISQTSKSLADILNISYDQISVIRSFEKKSIHFIKFYFEGEVLAISHKVEDMSAYLDVLKEQINLILLEDYYLKYKLL